MTQIPGGSFGILGDHGIHDSEKGERNDNFRINNRQL